MRANALRHRLLPSRVRPAKVHLGPGQSNYLNGWTNIDANFLTAKIDIWADISAKLPFRARNRRGVLLASCHRTSARSPPAISFFGDVSIPQTGRRDPGRPGPTPIWRSRNLKNDDLDWFGDFPDRRRSIGGRFANFILCGGEHLTILTSSYLRELAERCRF